VQVAASDRAQDRLIGKARAVSDLLRRQNVADRVKGFDDLWGLMRI